MNEHRFITTDQLANPKIDVTEELRYLDLNELTKKEISTTKIDDETINDGFLQIIDIAGNYFRNFGIEIHRLPTIRWAYGSDERASAIPGQIKITLKPLSLYEKEGIIVDDAFRKFRAFKVLGLIAHEFYHAISQEVVYIKPKQKSIKQLIKQTLYGTNHWKYGKYQFSRVRWGIGYVTKLKPLSQ